MIDTHALLDKLNPAQQEAVSAPLQNLLVLAGAGSGKTRVLVHRIIWLIYETNLSPYSLMAVTFTNKAAGEMKNRIEQLLNTPLQSLWVGTFHGLAHRLLRAHWQEANLPQNFQILDADDQYRLVKRVINSLNLDEAQWQPKQIQWFINGQKDEGRRPGQIPERNDLHLKTLIRIYATYEETCTRNGVIDFAEILLRSYELLLKNDELRIHYQQRFKHILVDEFQDTNSIQYAWLKLFSTETNHFTIVGDDDQSIYGWRGAKVENIHKFQEDFSNTRLIRLEQNYRSTSTILSAANALIANNEGRLGKNLWTSGEKGDLISLYTAFNELDEARFIVDQIKKALDQGMRRDEIALLYRSNAQSRVLEEALIQTNIPYRIYGGLRFFERAEIKDTLAYLRLVENRHDDAAFERVVNTPTRGIGEQTLQTLRETARAEQQSLWKTAIEFCEQKSLSARAQNALSGFLMLIEKIAADTQNLSLSDQTQHVIHASGILTHVQKEKGEKGQARIENLEELVNATKEFSPDLAENMTLLSAFLAHAALEAGEYQSGEEKNCVQLMTLHAAKGLEFPIVFMCGMEEGLFPHHLSADEPKRLEEERRLCYVGMTRAMKKLFMTYAEIRRHYGSENYHRVSRFINEIPSDLLQEVRLKTQIVRPVNRNFQTERNYEHIGDSSFKLGQSVTHPSFGDGIILNYEGQGPQARVQVKFARHGTKWLVLGFAKLEAV